jgi:hypothetical protein
MAARSPETSGPFGGVLRHVHSDPLWEWVNLTKLPLTSSGDLTPRRSVAQVVLSKGVHGDYQSISFGWGLSMIMPGN